VSEALGRVQKPAVDSFRGRRKLFLVFLVYPYEGAPAGYVERCERYWRQVAEQVLSLESKVGPVRHVYHESVYAAGDEGLELLKQLNRFSYEISRARHESGAVFEAFEERELALELSDLGRFMMLGFASSRVSQLVQDLHMQAEKKRNEHVIKVIDSTLQRDEVGLLFVSERHSLQFPGDIEVFSVVPPALDELHRWMRDEADRRRQEAAGATGKEPAQETQPDAAGEGDKEVA